MLPEHGGQPSPLPGSVPSNFAGTQSPNTGEGYAGIYVRAQNGEYREYILAPLLESLEANAHYLLSFYISMGDVGCASQLVGAYVSEDAPHSGSSSGHLDVTPQLETNQGWLTESEGWIYVSGCFIAEGGEQFITLGNFHPDSETPILEPCFNGISYYYIDDVVLEKISGDGNLPLELGGPEFACLSYTIDPGLQGYNYIWLIWDLTLYFVTVSHTRYPWIQPLMNMNGMMVLQIRITPSLLPALML